MVLLKRLGFLFCCSPHFFRFTSTSSPSSPMTSIASTSHPSDPHNVAEHLPPRSSKSLLASTWQVLDQVFPSPYVPLIEAIPHLFPSSLHRQASEKFLAHTALEGMVTARC